MAELANHLMCMGIFQLSADGRCQRKEGSGTVNFSMSYVFVLKGDKLQKCLAAVDFFLTIENTCTLSPEQIAVMATLNVSFSLTWVGLSKM